MTAMRPRSVPLLGAGLLAAILFALLDDLSRLAGAAMAPWFGWMLP